MAGEVAIKQQRPLMVQVVIEVNGALADSQQERAIEGHLLANEAHQGRRKGTAVQGLDHLGQVGNKRWVGAG